jgi:uncharacterized membrane protein
MSTTKQRPAGSRPRSTTDSGTSSPRSGPSAAVGGVSARLMVGLPLALGLVAGVAAAFTLAWEVAALLGWDVAALAYLLWCWLRIRRMDADETSKEAASYDPGPVGVDLMLVVTSVASLLAVGLVIVKAGNSSGVTKALLVALVMVSVLASWATVHTTYTLRYARLYYSGTDGGVDFNDDEPPSYLDFAYLSFTLGMTFQVSDTSLTSREFRVTVLRHALLSYLFGAVILAATINLVAGLSK